MQSTRRRLETLRPARPTSSAGLLSIVGYLAVHVLVGHSSRAQREADAVCTVSCTNIT